MSINKLIISVFILNPDLSVAQLGPNPLRFPFLAFAPTMSSFTASMLCFPLPSLFLRASAFTSKTPAS